MNAQESSPLLSGVPTMMMSGDDSTSASAPAVAVSILLIDDDVELCDLMQKFFARHGMSVEVVHNSHRGLARALAGGHDLVLLDVMMPDLDGFELLGQVRSRSQIPVIMLTARTAQADRIRGLNAGADDYLPKPFGPEELLARIRAVLRRMDNSRQSEHESFVVGPIRLIPGAREVLCEGRVLGLTSIEFDILEQLVRSAGRVLSRDALMTALYQRRATPFDRSIDVHISHIRKKLKRHGDRIRTVRGVGYLFCTGAEGEGEIAP
ncbi:response regulator transcription factor [Singulisphaera acidiphila]|uniref:Response regulator with CheY-like receiver domain and winged-helix DNA-binding domain n=1 Tax=Singulisphaera acidiphila (strain ATCC BAA-1392 / DSM 18658 / VKM B-2454 / MOB10) TaxID=886293 RepID=L0DGX9_SINAD|nr:response regulator transcription factor [Singulisphaera acidiphila]AGA28634.1 response regulator with CheY-like receiver domain and winged-helix DNA-binding domain [Singulisphaera acidiphila DSM 18658]